MFSPFRQVTLYILQYPESIEVMITESSNLGLIEEEELFSKILPYRCLLLLPVPVLTDLQVVDGVHLKIGISKFKGNVISICSQA